MLLHRATLLLALGLLTTACASSSAVVAQINVDSSAKAQLDSFTVQVATAAESTGMNILFENSYNMASTQLPGSLVFTGNGSTSNGTLPAGNLPPASIYVGQPGTPFTITVTGSKGGQVLITKVITLSIPTVEKNLPITLEGACVAVSCSANQSCSAGICSSTQIDSNSLQNH